VVILKSLVLKLFTRVPSGYIEVKSSLLKLLRRVPNDYIEVITSKAIIKGAWWLH
jgi:hypothetical protein